MSLKIKNNIELSDTEFEYKGAITRGVKLWFRAMGASIYIEGYNGFECVFLAKINMPSCKQAKNIVAEAVETIDIVMNKEELIAHWALKEAERERCMKAEREAAIKFLSSIEIKSLDQLILDGNRNPQPLVNKKDGVDIYVHSAFYRGASKSWVALNNGFIVGLIQMDECPENEDIVEFREKSRRKLAKLGKVFSGMCSCTRFFPNKPDEFVAEIERAVLKERASSCSEHDTSLGL